MHHAGANVLSPTVRDLSITHRNLPLSRAHPISCPQSRSQRPVYSPPHRERSLDQIVIYLTTEALAALPLRAQPPPPTEMPAKPEPMHSLLPKEISRSGRNMLYITRGRYHSQFYHSQAHPLPPTAMPAKPEPMCSLLHTARDPLSDRNISSEAPRSSSTAPNPQSMRPPQGSTTIQGLRRRNSGSSGTPTRTSDDINGRGSPRCGNRIPHRKHRNLTTDHTARSCATPSRSPLGADTVDFSVRISRPGKRPNVDANGRYHRTPLNTKL